MENAPHIRTSSIPADRFLPGIHALRAVAALMVVLFHLQHLGGFLPPAALSGIGSHFGFGVHLFFVLSAFSLGVSTSPTMSRPDWIRDYLVKRFFRIAPLFYVMLLLYVPVIAMHRWRLPDMSTWTLNAVFLFNLVPEKCDGIVWSSWTIGVEMLFYLIFPILLSVSSRFAVCMVLLAVSFVASVTTRVILEGAGDVLGNYAVYALPSNFGIFMAGFVSFKLYALAKSRGSNLRENLRAIEVACLGFVLVLLVGLLSPPGLWLVRIGRPDHMFWGLLFGGLALWQGLSPSRWFATRGLQWVGERSYSVYLLHPLLVFHLSPFLKPAYDYMQDQIGHWAFIPISGLVIAILLVCANLTYHLVERPGLRLGKKVLAFMRDGTQPQPTA